MKIIDKLNQALVVFSIVFCSFDDYAQRDSEDAKNISKANEIHEKISPLLTGHITEEDISILGSFLHDNTPKNGNIFFFSIFNPHLDEMISRKSLSIFSRSKSTLSQNNENDILETETLFIKLLNQYRIDNKLLKFEKCKYLQQTAEIQSNYLAENSLRLSHENSNPGMNSLSDRFMSTKPDYVPLLGECIALCFILDANGILKQFKNSPRHDEILLSDTYIGTIGIKISKVINDKSIPYYIAVLVLG